jgi:hypothetical protein
MTRDQSINPLATQLVQYRVMELAPQPGLGPLTEAAVRGLKRHPERAGNGAVPPPCGRDRNSGTNGSTNDHNSSGTNRNDNRSTTSQDHVQRIITST